VKTLGGSPKAWNLDNSIVLEIFSVSDGVKGASFGPSFSRLAKVVARGAIH
jgi:hypothetical protein